MSSNIKLTCLITVLGIFLLLPLAAAAEESLGLKMEVPEYVFTNSANNITVKVYGSEERYAGKYLALYADQELLSAKQLAEGNQSVYQFSWRAEGLTKHEIRAVLADDQDITRILQEEVEERTAIINGNAGSSSLLPFTSGEAARGDFIFTLGDSRYSGQIKQSDVYSVRFLPELPAGAVVKQARLFTFWTWSHWGQMGVDPQMVLSLDNQPLIPDRQYSDRKGWGKFDYPSGTWTYDVTKLVAGKGPYVAEVKNRHPENFFCVNGIGLLIIYEDSMSEKAPLKYWINEGCDILMARPDSFATAEEATTWTYFDQVPDPEEVETATLINLVPSGDKGQNMLIFNKGIYQGLWTGNPYPDFSYNIQDVTRAIKGGKNEVGFRDLGDYMVPSGAVLLTRLKTAQGTGGKSDPPSGQTENVDNVTGIQSAAKDQLDQNKKKTPGEPEKKAPGSEEKLKQLGIKIDFPGDGLVRGKVLVRTGAENLTGPKGLTPTDNRGAILMLTTMLMALTAGFWTERAKLINCRKLDRRTICFRMVRR